MTTWDLTAEDGLLHLTQWGHTTAVMQYRVLDPQAGPVTREGDLQLFALAARQSLRFAYLVHKLAPSGPRIAVRRAIDDFEGTAGDVKDVRDVLDHLDDYLQGSGRIRAKAREDYATDWLHVFRPYQMWSEEGVGTYRLHVSPRPGETLTVDVARDGAAVRRLVEAVTKALRK